MTQWTADPKMPLRGMTADRRGTVYVVQKGEITSYEGTTGKLLGTVGAGGGRYDDVAVDGRRRARRLRAQDSRDNMVQHRLVGAGSNRLSGGRQRADRPLGAEHRGPRPTGLGNIYALGEFNDAVFKFSARRALPDAASAATATSRDCSARPAPSPWTIRGASTSRTSRACRSSTQNGRYLKLIKVKGAASGLAFNESGELFVVARTQVWKFAPIKP